MATSPCSILCTTALTLSWSKYVRRISYTKRQSTDTLSSCCLHQYLEHLSSNASATPVILYFSDRKFVTRHGRLARRTSGHACHACSSTCEPILRDACTLSQKGNASNGSRIGEKVALCVVRVLLGHSQRLSRPYLAGNPRGYPHKCAIAGPIGSLSRITYVGERITGEPIGKSRITIKRPELPV